MFELVLLAASLSSDFPGGNTGPVEWVSETKVRVGVPGQSDQDGRNRQASWYYFRLDDVQGAELEIVLTDLIGEYNYKKGTHPVRATTVPVYSYDQQTWTHFQQTSWDEDAAELSIRLRPQKNVVWIAHTPPYTFSRLQRFSDEIADHPHFGSESVGTTLEGRPMPLWTIHDSSAARDKPVVWLMFRQHAWESATSWACEGAVRWLLGDSNDASALRKQVVWKIFPMADPDGAELGGVRFNRNGYDLNRNWDARNKATMPEIHAQHSAVSDWLKAGGDIDFFLTLHNTESSEYIEGPAQYRTFVNRFRTAMTEASSFEETRPEPRDMKSSTTEGLKGRMSVNQGLYADFAIPAMLMETRVERHPELNGPRTIPEWKALGEGLIRAAAETVAVR